MTQAEQPGTQEPEGTREKLIAAGLEIFAARGFAGATTRAIAERAQVALATLPYHFKTKEALWKAAADHIFGLFAAHMSVARDRCTGLSPRDRTRLLLSEYVRFSAHYPQMVQIFLRDGISPNPRTDWLVEHHIRPNFEYVKNEVTHAVENGYGRSGRPEHLYYMMVGAATLPYVMGANSSTSRARVRRTAG